MDDMLESITLKFTESPELTVPVRGITVFVGPNNSGKSLVLREIEAALTTHPFPRDTKLVKDYDVRWPSVEYVQSVVKAHRYFQPSNLPIEHVTLGRINPGGGVEKANIHEPSLIQQTKSQADKRWFATQFLRWGMIRLDGRSRFNLTNDVPGGDLLSSPQNTLQHVFSNDASRNHIRKIIYDAFSLHFVVDPTQLGTLRIRLSPTPPLQDEQSLNSTARAFHQQAIHIKDASDGVQAFSGIVTAVLSGEYHTILVDEPEAFLHPPLARKLGKHLTSLARDRDGSLLAATHSADFLMGCVQAGDDVRVVRLEYRDGKSRGRTVDSSELTRLLRTPLMRSANVVSGLFYDGVVVTESDNDRAFYNEIYARLGESDETLPSLLFVNAQNKQTVIEIIKPLRSFGVPAAAIVDIDVVKDGGKTWIEWLNASRVPNALHSGMSAQRAAIKSCFEQTGRDMKTDGGIDILPGSDRSAAIQFFETLEQFGIFVVREGELENWLSPLGVKGKKTNWTVEMLNRLGSDPTNSNYVRPASGDVWAFIRRVVNWISDPSRRGME